MYRGLIILIFVLHHLPILAGDVLFYGDTLSLSDVPLYEGKLIEGNLKKYREEVAITSFLSDIIDIKKKLDVNDYYLCRLIYSYLNQNTVATGKQRAVLVYTCLKSLGYKTHIGYYGSNYFVFVHSERQIFSQYMVTIKGKKYYDIHPKEKKLNRHILIKGGSNKGKDFDFSIQNSPQFDNQNILTKEASFNHMGDSIIIPISINKTLVDFLDDSPQLDDFCYFQLPLSDTVHKTLIHFFESKVLNMSEQEGVRYILSFCRTIAYWEDDLKSFGYDKPMFAEEVLFYDYSDCEDRSVLFYFLVKEIYNLPMVVLKYPNHMNIAISIEGKGFKHTLKYNGKTYVVCEPTNSSNNQGLGESVFFEKNPSPKVIGTSF